MLAVLVAEDPHGYNTFFSPIAKALKGEIRIIRSKEVFLSAKDKDFDIVHIQWPEYLTHKRGAIKSLSDVELVIDRVKFWKSKGSKIVVTRHNDIPHNANPQILNLYQEIYRMCDGVIHFGPYSIAHDSFEEFYQNEVRHVVINHPGYFELDHGISRKEARRSLGLKMSDTFVLVFGKVRSEEEQMMVVNAFKGLANDGSKKMVITDGYTSPKPDASRQPLKWVLWKSNFMLYRYRLKMLKIDFRLKKVPDELVQNYLRSADILFVPRINSLNSGLVYLGLTFGCIVVGPDVGNIGGVLKSLQNPVFDPLDSSSVIDALKSGCEALNSDIGEKNLNYAAEQLNPDLISSEYLKFYDQLLKTN